MENEAFVTDSKTPNDSTKAKKQDDKKLTKNNAAKSKKQRSKKKYSVQLEKNTVEMSALSKPTRLKHINDDADKLINVLLKGRRSVIQREIEQAEEKDDLNVLDNDGFAALHHTTRYCRLEATETLLENGADVNVRSRDDHFTPLHIASRFGWYEACKILLQHGADASLQSVIGATALHLACRRGNLNIVELLGKQPGIDVDAKDHSLRTPLYLAASLGHDKVVDMLLQNGADLCAVTADGASPLKAALMNGYSCNDSEYTRIAVSLITKAFEMRKCQSLNIFDMDGFNLLHIAASSNNIAVMKMVLDRGGEVNIPNIKNYWTALHIACAMGNLNMATFLVERGADVHCQDINGRTPLHNAAQFGRDNILQFLIDKGAVIDARDNTHKTPFLLMASSPKAHPAIAKVLIDSGADTTTHEAYMKSCLHLAVESGNYEMIEFLLDIDSAEENLYSPDVQERVPLHYAAENINLKILKLLLTKQRRLNFQDEDQQTALYLAAKNNRADHVGVLGRAGASVNQRDEDGKTALHAAAENGSKKVCKILILLGAGVNSRDSKNRTPLMYAAAFGCTKTVNALLDLNANIDDTSVGGDTALLTAIRHNHSAVVEVLMRHNANVNHRDHSGAGPFETAVKVSAKESIKVICSCERWKEVLNDRSSTQGQRPMQLLIKHFPEAAAEVMNKCISRPMNVNPTHRDFTVTYDFEQLDPGPDDPDFIAGHRYFGPQTMVKYNRQDLLLHPLTQMLLDKKWSSFGSYIYYFSLIVYFWFISSYSYFVIVQRNILPTRRNATKMSKKYNTDGDKYGIALMIMIFAMVQIAKEIVQMIFQRKNYFKQPENLVEWVLYTQCITFLVPFVAPDALVDWMFPNAGQNYNNPWIAAIFSIILCYSNFALFLRRFSLFGIYISMFIVVFRSLIKVMLVFIQFLVGFTVVFYILFKEQPAFRTIGLALSKTIVMSTGEVDFTSTFVDSLNQVDAATGFPLNPFPEMGFVVCAFFVSVMCITLTNLLIGIAIGDIDSVQRSAELQRLAMQVEFVAEIEEKYPRFITRRHYMPTIEIMPNKRSFTWRFQKILRIFQGALKDLTSTTGEATTERQNIDINDMAATLEKNRRQIKALVTAMESQTSMIQSIAEKLNINEISQTIDNTPLEQLVEDEETVGEEDEDIILTKIEIN